MLSLVQLLTTTLLLYTASSSPVSPRHGDDGPACPAKPPHGGKCWKDILALEWKVHGFDYHASYIFSTPAHQNSWGYVNFNLTNNVVPYTATCSASSNQLSEFFFGTMEYPCTLPSTAPAGSAVSFKFSRPTGQLDIKETIICNENKITGDFVASGAKNLTLTCTNTYYQNPNWTIGQIYSDQEVKCTPVDVTIKPSQIVA
ncbi:hypothetical protein B0H63DRAFT_471048 [Podospora didyma]|uniref:AA1-like domain-containing protein n=1 Tax=Podospora didyma TaxID=330526 RepID=A0AAE0NUV9_9PEZI|nr:hypothetical protein B0H63DRAFT_471048 [Podospora didyma]